MTARHRRVWGLAFFAFVFLIAFRGAEVQADRADFAKVLQMMPSDGPPERYGNVALRNRSTRKGMAPVIFPHWLHRAKFTCNVCHVDLGFSMAKGGSGITRGANLAGRFCGACHDGKTAFSVKYDEQKYCDRCHLAKVSSLDERFKEFTKDFPKAEYGNKIDWVKALEQGVIKPKTSFYSEETFLDLPANLEQPLWLGTSSPRSKTIFSHKTHVAWTDCSGCHPEIFNIKKKGTESFSMEKNLYGWFCGTCHIRVSFPMTDCNRCHPNIKSGVVGRSMGF